MLAVADAAGHAAPGPAGIESSGAPAPSPEYRRLAAALEDYRQIAHAGGWPPVPAGPTIEPGSTDPRVPALASRLAASGDLVGHAAVLPGQEDVYGRELQAAVRRFQARHGLEPDMRVGRATLRELNVPAGTRVQQLLLNLERTRQVFDAAPADVLLINIPAFELRLVRSRQVVWTTRVIVGEIEMETPAFETALEQVVLNPTWAVPRKIATEELLPIIRANPGYLARGGYVVLDVDGSRADPASIDWSAAGVNDFPYRLVQQPGPTNELGRVKFLIPNDYGVTMHDTPKKQLFARDSRAFSHGCIRIDEPVAFAAQLLAPYGWNRTQLDAELDTGKTLSIPLDEPLPVIVAYLTAEVGDDGTVFFYRDVYSRDCGPARQGTAR